MGGVTSLNYNLASHPADPQTEQWVIHIDVENPSWTRADLHFPVDKELYFSYSTDDNTFHLLKKLHKLIPEKEGALVLNYEIEMSMLDHYKVKQTVYQLIHDDYNVNLAKKYGHVVDVFICHNSVIYDKLRLLFPDRLNDIFYLPHGVKVPATFRKPKEQNRPLQLLFLGRMAKSKGVFDLPVISRHLRSLGVSFEWTCIGGGPELNKLKECWDPSDPVTFLTPATNEEVLSVCADKDVFVLPTKFEGSPVSLLETMSTGLVPVITDLPGGITDIVSSDIGYRIAIDDNESFARAIHALYSDPARLDRLSMHCRQKIVNEFNIVDTASKYHALFLRYKDFYREKEKQKKKVGARLDHPLISPGLTRLVRKIHKKVKK